jgi:hypothetical protein
MENYTTIQLEQNALSSVQESISHFKNILEKKLSLCKTRLTSFEKLKQMDTLTFLQLFEQGELGDNKEWLEWEHFAVTAKSLQKKIEALESIRYER